MKSNFLQRAITGILFVGVLVGCILYDPWTFSALFVVISALTIREFGHLINQVEGVSINKNITMLAGVYLYMAVMAFCTNLSGSKIFLPYLLLIMYLMISELYLKKENPVMNWAYSMLSQLYIALPFAMLNVLSFHTSPMDTSVSYNPILPLSVFVFIWLSDTGAYCVGSLIGRHREGERIPLNKLWNRRQSTKFNGTSYITQRAAEAIYTPEGQRQIKETIDYYMDNARTMKQGLETAGLKVYGGVNAPYIWLKTPDGTSSWRFFEQMLYEANVVGTPGVGFGPSGEGYIRLTAFGKHEDCVEAMKRIRKWLK